MHLRTIFALAFAAAWQAAAQESASITGGDGSTPSLSSSDSLSSSASPTISDDTNSTPTDLSSSSTDSSSTLTDTSSSTATDLSSSTSDFATTSTENSSVSSIVASNSSTTLLEGPRETTYAELGDHQDMPAVELTPEDSALVNTLELESYADFLSTSGLLPAADGSGEARVVLPACPPPALLQKRVWPFKDRPKRKPGYSCSPSTLSISIQWHLVTSVPKLFPADIRTRINTQMGLFNDVYSRYGITFQMVPKIEQYTDSVFTAYEYDYEDLIGPRKLQRTKDNIKFMSATRKGGPDVLNVWIVESAKAINSYGLNGHAIFPGSKYFTFDGIILWKDALAPLTLPTITGDDSSCLGRRLQGGTLIHETGHWMGLYHPFEGAECTDGDYISDTNSYQDPTNKMGCCLQLQCGTGIEYRVQNWMSYSECRGTRADNSVSLTAFSNGQRSTMLAHFLTFRKGLNCGAVFNKKRALKEQSPEIQKREVEKVTLLADLLLNNCSVAIQDVYEEETIPLPTEVLKSYSVAASSLLASPTAADPNNPRPSTAILGTATATPSQSSSSEGKSPGSKSSGDALTQHLVWPVFGSLFAVCFGAWAVLHF